MDELKGLMSFYKSGDGIDVIKLYKEMQEANFYFTKTLEKNLLEKIEESKAKEKLELKLEEMKTFFDIYPNKTEALAFINYKYFLEKQLNHEEKKNKQLNMKKDLEERLNKLMNKELKLLLDKNNEIINIINEDENKQKEYLDNYFKELEIFLKNNKILFDTFDMLLDENEDNKMLFNKYIKYLNSIKEIEIEENKINNLYNMLLEYSKQNIDIKNYFILCKLILILKNDTINMLQNVYWKNPKIYFQMQERGCINDIGNKEIEESLNKFDEYKGTIILDSITKALNNFFGENINIKEQIDSMENNNYTFKYGHLYVFLQNLKETEKKNIIPLQNFMELIYAENNNDRIFENILNFIRDENDKNKIKIIEKGKINIYNKKITSIEKLNKDKIIVYFDRKLNIYSSNDLSLLYAIEIDILSPISILQNGNILLITSENGEKGDYITILNSHTLKTEQKIPLFIPGETPSLIELSNGDIAYSNKIGISIYKKKNEKYYFFKLLPFPVFQIKQINEDSFISLGEMIIKFSIKDYSITGVIPNLKYNTKLVKIKNDICVLYGSEGGACSKSLICFIDVNKFEVISYRYLNRVIPDIIPLLGENYFIISKWYVYTNSYEKKLYKKICKPFKYENIYGFIESFHYNRDKDDDYEKIKYIDTDFERLIMLTERKILYQDEFNIYLKEYLN